VFLLEFDLWLWLNKPMYYYYAVSILRHEGLLRVVIEGKIQGMRPRGRPRIGMLNELKEGSHRLMKRRADHGGGWKCWIPETCHLTEH